MVPFVFSEPCPYFPEKRSSGEILPGILCFDRYETLIPFGWRRSGAILYRYRCPGCSLCIPIRLPASKILRGKRFSRLTHVNADVEMKLLPPEFREEHFVLYKKYIRARHGGSDFPGEESYQSLLDASIAAVSEYRDSSGTLLAVGFMDILPSGLSSVYFAFDPAQGKRSLGSYSIFAEAKLALDIGKEYYYLGFWVPRAAKMDYKADFSPFQLSLSFGCEGDEGAETPSWKEFMNKAEAHLWLSASAHR